MTKTGVEDEVSLSIQPARKDMPRYTIGPIQSVAIAERSVIFTKGNHRSDIAITPPEAAHMRISPELPGKSRSKASISIGVDKLRDKITHHSFSQGGGLLLGERVGRISSYPRGTDARLPRKDAIRVYVPISHLWMYVSRQKDCVRKVWMYVN